jgi:REP element-mobilizing transposase RayT
MAIRTVINENGVYFITLTCYNWLPLIEIANAYNDVYNFLEVLKTKGCKVVAYVIMPNHLHLMIFYANEQETLNALIGQGKRFMAYGIVKRLRQTFQSNLLGKLSMAVSIVEKARDKQHQIWKTGFDKKHCRTESFLLQKLDYLHNNPIRGKWNLAKDRESYEHSSCLFYSQGIQQHCSVTHYKEVLEG